MSKMRNFLNFIGIAFEKRPEIAPRGGHCVWYIASRADEGNGDTGSRSRYGELRRINVNRR